ncbi:uncharacterized protein LOC124144604 [Haliotis rufescens]|uniref:uncharacterized protein LOC124144604 n=1 Tax=Haliotis rufescens TaxID=6454 RepID=UPI00201E8065|nr:uncharacterized protein LOC124144604 [Haliotis rufescens]
MEAVFEEGNLEEWIEKAIGHSIIPVNRPLCSPSMIKQVKISQRAEDHSSAIIGIVMGALFLVATTAAVGLSYQWHLMFRKRTRKVCPENSSVELQMVEEETRD